MPLSRRIPKFGFHNPNRVAYKAVNVSRLARLAEEGKLDPSAPVTPNVLEGLGLVQKKDRVKVLGKGDITVSLKVEAHGFSASAKEKIEKAGGEISIIN
jgi:large subunit ribosomal protein L15